MAKQHKRTPATGVHTWVCKTVRKRPRTTTTWGCGGSVRRAVGERTPEGETPV